MPNEIIIKNTLEKTIKKPFVQLLEICNSRDSEKNKIRAIQFFCTKVLKALDDVK